MEGWIKLHRKLVDWEWYNDVNTFRLFIHLLLKANHADAKWRGILIKKGELITSISKLSTELCLSSAKVRVSINKLKRTGEIASQNTTHYSKFQILKYADYQVNDKPDSKAIANQSQADSKPIATNKNKEEEREEKEKKPKGIYEHSYFSDEPLNKLFIEHLQLRKTIKAVNSPSAIKGLENKLRELSNNKTNLAIKLIEQSIVNSWKTYFPLKDNDIKQATTYKLKMN